MLTCILLVAISVTTAATCDKYTCKPDSMNWASGTCGYYNTTETTWYYKDTCKNEEVCQIGATPTIFTCTTPAAPQPIPIFPGDKCGNGYTCSNNSTCASGTVCPGRALNETCNTTDMICAPTLYCPTTGENTGKCQQMKAADETCTTDNECGMNMGCYFGNSTTPATTGNCTLWASLAPFDYVDATHFDPTLNISPFCPNLAAYKGSTGANDIRCTEPLVAATSNPVNCTVGDNTPCSSNPVLGNVVVQTPCLCGQNPTGESYCTLHTNDPVGQKVVNLFKSWVTSSDYINKCSDPERGKVTICAMNYWKNYDEYNYYQAQALLYPLIQDSPDCVIETVQYAYYKLKEEYDSAVAIVVAGLIALAI